MDKKQKQKQAPKSACFCYCAYKEHALVSKLQKISTLTHQCGYLCFYIAKLEIYFSVVVAALEQFFHLPLGRTAWVRARASIADCILGNLRESLEEDVLWYKALFARVAVGTVVLDTVRNVEVVVHLA